MARLGQIVLASGNAGKAREFQQGLAGLLSIRSQSEWNLVGVEETGLSFVENAILKARHAAQATGLPALADDSGLCVEVLDGAPGIFSARFAGSQASDADNNARLLSELAGLPAEQRRAHFVCVLVLMRHAEDPQPLICEGNWHGHILDAPRGSHGFGYDPLFQPAGLECSSAELEPQHKNRISHRGQAMERLVAALQRQTIL